MRLDGRVEDSADSQGRAAAEALFADVERAHRAEDVDAYLSFFDEDAVWVTSRGVCYRGRPDLGDYLHRAIPGGLGDGTVRYVVESIHSIGPNSALVVVDQTYTNRDGEPRDEHARHTHTYVVSLRDHYSRILAGQNTVRVATDTLGRPSKIGGSS